MTVPTETGLRLSVYLASNEVLNTALKSGSGGQNYTLPLAGTQAWGQGQVKILSSSGVIYGYALLNNQ